MSICVGRKSQMRVVDGFASTEAGYYRSPRDEWRIERRYPRSGPWTVYRLMPDSDKYKYMVTTKTLKHAVRLVSNLQDAEIENFPISSASRDTAMRFYVRATKCPWCKFHEHFSNVSMDLANDPLREIITPYEERPGPHKQFNPSDYGTPEEAQKVLAGIFPAGGLGLRS